MTWVSSHEMVDDFESTRLLDWIGFRNKSMGIWVLESESKKASGLVRRTRNWEDTLFFSRKDSVSFGEHDLGLSCVAS